MIAGIFSVSARENYSRDINILPTPAQAIIKNNFKSEVNHIKIDKELGRISEYEVVLNDGSEITFDRNGNWKDIEVGPKNSVPAGLIPPAIIAYIKQNQKDASIIGIEKEKFGYEVELSNGIEIKFNSAGKFIKYDN